MRHWQVVRSWGVLFGTLALAACAGQAPPQYGGGTALPAFPESSGGALPPPPGAPGKPVALLLPLTGAMAPVGQVLANAAKLAGGVTLDVRDTGSTAAGAAAAAQAALAGGDGLILGPLTSAEAHAVAPVAGAAGVDVLAFTNDSSIDAPGIWALGVTPAQQVRRVVQVAAAAGRNQIAALLPDDQFGHSLGDALSAAAQASGATTGSVVYYADGSFSGLNQAVQQVSDFADRGQTIENQIKAAQELNTQAGRDTADQLQHQPIPAPAFNALFIGTTDSETLAELATLLPYYAVAQPQVQFIGPALWAKVTTDLANSGVYNGALYAAPDPAAAGGFDAKYQGAYGAPPPAIANIAYDAAGIAARAAGGGTPALTDPAGFDGANGKLVLLPNGQVLRGLAVFEVAPGGAVLTAPAQVPTPTS